MNEGPATYIKAALSSLGITCRSLDISHYSPTAFGNLLATAETSEGKLRITYDRGFYVETHQWKPGAPSIGQITDALEKHKVAANIG